MAAKNGAPVRRAAALGDHLLLGGLSHADQPLGYETADVKGRTALWYAACHGHSLCVDALLRAHSNLEEPALGLLTADEDGESPITIAFKRGHTDMIIEMVKSIGMDYDMSFVRYSWWWWWQWW